MFLLCLLMRTRRGVSLVQAIYLQSAAQVAGLLTTAVSEALEDIANMPVVVDPAAAAGPPC